MGREYCNPLALKLLKLTLELILKVIPIIVALLNNMQLITGIRFLEKKKKITGIRFTTSGHPFIEQQL